MARRRHAVAARSEWLAVRASAPAVLEHDGARDLLRSGGEGGLTNRRGDYSPRPFFMR